eukprot:GHRR01020282.1.p1 GENE.GHRR01020282.1~~GHRR01020282.1.p1  ORF type:complete len:228 (+),score=98.40 GHRR01020282.1:845-1528(+)
MLCQVLCSSWQELRLHYSLSALHLRLLAGFMVSRMLGAAPTIADAIIDQLASPGDKATAAVAAARPSSEQEAASMAASVWRAAWPVERLRQRAFFCFGMDVLLKLNLAETRTFFNAFFSLSAFHWHGFLSARLGFRQLIGFGLSLFAKSSNEARLDLLTKGLPGLITMLLQLVPTLGDYYGVKKQLKQQRQQVAVPVQRQQQQPGEPAAVTAAVVSSSNGAAAGRQQ